MTDWVQVATVERVECLTDRENNYLRVSSLEFSRWPEDPCARYLRIRGSLYPCRHFSNRGQGIEFNSEMGLCQKEYGWAVPDYFVRTWDLNRPVKEILQDASKAGKAYCVDAGDDLPPDNTWIYLLPLFEAPGDGGKTCLILRPCTEKLTAEAMDSVSEWESPHWLERIGISVFNGDRFVVMRDQEMPHQIIHLM